MIMKKRWMGLLLTLLLLLPISAYPDTPLEEVKAHVNRVLNILRDPSLQGEAGKRTKIERIQAIAEEFFDFSELSRRSLGQAWNQMTPEQQKEFVKLYESLLKRTYADRIVSYTNEKLTYGKEIPLGENTFEVQTTILSQGSEVPINYRVLEANGHWKVYDVLIEGVSLINNYRSQFRAILANKAPTDLIEILRKKVGGMKPG